MIYTTGTIAGSGNTLTGTGTNFTAAGSLIRIGCTLITFTSPVQVLQITGITSGTALAVTPIINPAIPAGTRYAILLSDSLSVDGLAQDIAETFGMYQRNMSGFADVMNGSGDVTITINGTQVTVPGQKSLAKKGANNDITSLSALTTALSVPQGGTGAPDAPGARTNLGVPSGVDKQMVKAWVAFNADGSIRDSFNISSVTKIGLGNFQINFTKYMSDRNFSVVAGVKSAGTGTRTIMIGDTTNPSFAENTVAIRLLNQSGLDVDPAIIFVHVIGS